MLKARKTKYAGKIRLGGEPGPITAAPTGEVKSMEQQKVTDPSSLVDDADFTAASAPNEDFMVQPRIQGYRVLSANEAALMNEIKAQGQHLAALIERLGASSVRVDQRWVSIGATHLQQGLMALSRAVAQPTTFG